MTRVKIVKGFYTTAAAKRVEAAERKLANAEGREIVSIDIEEGCVLYNKSDWFKTKIQKFGRPKPGQFVVVVYYIDNAELTVQTVPNAVTIIKKNAAAVAIKGKAAFSKMSEAAAKAKAILIELATLCNTHLVKKVAKAIQFERYSSPRLAA